MLPATTLVHQGAMDIAVHAVSSFARHFSGTYRLDIHTDGSVDPANQELLMEASSGTHARIVTPDERRPVLEERLAEMPLTRALLDGVGYNAKLELPMVATGPYFYFDSDIVWLRPVKNLKPEGASNAFSTESWSWYNGASNEKLWIQSKTPRRVNSGFYYLGDPFPFDRMEDMLEKSMFDSTSKYNTDQEIMAYLFPDMKMYHPEDLKRSRRNVMYDVMQDDSAALHFPGGMWRGHLTQFGSLSAMDGRPGVDVRFQPALPLSRMELGRMRMQVKLSDSRIIGRGINMLRKLRGGG